MRRLLLITLLLTLLGACGSAGSQSSATQTAPAAPTDPPASGSPASAPTPPPATPPPSAVPPASGSPTATPAGVPASVTDELWVGRSIYFLMVDRFANGDPGNDNADNFKADPKAPRGWHGGDLQGVIDQLDYIKGMGFDAIWITPVTKQRGTQAYHGYHQHDPYQIDGHFGTMDTLRELVAQAHEREMLVMLDVVPNHTGDFQPGGIAAPPFDDPSWYNNQGTIKDSDYSNQARVEQGDIAGLDDLNQDNPATRAELLKWIAWLRSESGVDGLRIDTAKHMPKDFLADFDRAAAIHTMGEIYQGDVTYVAPYTEHLDAVTDFPLYYALNRVVKGEPVQNVQRLLQSDGLYRNAHTNGTFIDNHDVQRLLCTTQGRSEEEQLAQLRQALALLFTLRGIPIVYYGTEQHFRGCNDPANREDMFESFDPQTATYQWLAQLNAVRKAHPALMMGASADRYVDANGWAFQRSSGADTVVVCVNVRWQDQSFAAAGLADLPDGTVLRDELGAGSVTVQGGAITCDLGPKQVAVYAPER